jgi:elongation factor 2 kinase
VRHTPQAFSHFTFERSNHELIVVDIQGVGDLYTDPQIHTVKGTEYGEGNLGIKGFALFFSSHICNEVCRCLGKKIFQNLCLFIKSLILC